MQICHGRVQPLPRAGSEHVNSAIFFSGDSKWIYAITLTTNDITEENIEAGQRLFDQILPAPSAVEGATFRFVQ